MDSAAWLFREITALTDRGGADDATLVSGVDHRERVRLSPAELRDGLRRLETAGLVAERDGKWTLAPAIAC